MTLPSHPIASLFPIDLIFCQFQKKTSLFHPRAVMLVSSCLECSFNSCSLLRSQCKCYLFREASQTIHFKQVPQSCLPYSPLFLFLTSLSSLINIFTIVSSCCYLFWQVSNRYFPLSAILGIRENCSCWLPCGWIMSCN